jgi:uncharacterized membrane protein YjjP (DUF1212 family)
MNPDARDKDPEEALLLSADAARLVLESGGETYRAEETAVAFASALGGAEAECYATPTGIVLSFTGIDGRARSIVRRITKRAMNLERVARIDDLSRRLVAGRIGFDEAAAELDRVERLPERPLPLLLLGAAMVAGFFTLFFGGSWNDALAAAVVGTVVSRIGPQLARRQMPDFFINLVAGAAATALCLLARRSGLADGSDATVIGVIMLLVPGVAVTNAIRDIVAGDLVSGVARGADAFMAAAAISIGAGGAYMATSFLAGVGP